MTTVFAGMAASLDGLIQSTSGDLSWLDDAMAPGEDYGFAQTEARTGAYVIGANTYREIGRSGGSGYRPTSSPMTPPSPRAGTCTRTPATWRS